MTVKPIALETDVLVIGSGAAGMYAAIEATRGGARVLLADRSLIGRGGATVMAQMTVAVALGEETPDDWHFHYDDTIKAGRGLCSEKLSELLCREGPDCIREMDQWGVGWARKDGHITAAMAPGHDRPRCVYVDFLNTGPAVSKTLRTAMARNKDIHKAGDLCIVDLAVTDGEVAGAVAYHVETGAPGHDRRQSNGAGDRRTDAALSPQQRVGEYGRRWLCAGLARRRAADRHGIRPVLSDRASGAAAHRHGPDHVGSVPLQARRAPAQRPHGGIHLALRLGRGRQIHPAARSRDLCHRQGGRGRPRLAAWRRVAVVRALQRRGAARCVRPGDRPARGERHRSHAHAGRGGADRALPHGRRRRRAAT